MLRLFLSFPGIGLTLIFLAFMGLIGGLPGLERGLIGLSLTGILDFSICGIGGFSSASIFDHFSEFFCLHVL